MNAEHAIQAAVMADKWAANRFGTADGEFLGIAWEAASSVRPEFSRRKAGVSKDRVSQLRFRALERLGGAP